MQKWTARPRRKHEASMRKHEDMTMENHDFRTIMLIVSLLMYGLVYLCIWAMWMDEKKRKDGQ